MTLYTYIHGESMERIWGLTSGQRIERVLKTFMESTRVDDLSVLKRNDSVLIFHGGRLFDDRLIQYLAETPNMILQLEEDGKKVAVAAHVSAGLAHQALEMIEETSGSESLVGVKTRTLETLPIAFQQGLRKSAPPFALPISAKKAGDLEQRLYDWSYKGVTDLVTKWVWPLPARWVVGQCVRFGIHPNHVTFIGLVLVILAGVLFACGQYGWGLLAGWVMTLLDTVDGKLARVTVTSSRFGHYFDHVIDLVHPPVWYVLWGLGLGMSYPNGGGWFSLTALLWCIVIGYVLGRLTEGLFSWCLGGFGIFCWRPVDSYFRLITGRRNPNLILLTAGVLLGRPDLGLATVAFWTVGTSLFLLARLGMAGWVRMTRGPLRSWFMDLDEGTHAGSLAVRIFTKRECLL
ncbi:MAG: CDP-alcohol phosphatidyltransferase family protein [Deltaproteobacteria bacterium]|nr:CDP-alcohol phosphatidyltransferase family protein [Deltaproteobacteria bacterium]